MLRSAAESIDLLRKAGMDNAFEVYAYKPAEGVGYCMPGEATKMKTDQAARKRAEADALKVAFDLPFASEVGNGDRVGYVDAEWSDVTDKQPGPEWTAPVVEAGMDDLEEEAIVGEGPKPEPPAPEPPKADGKRAKVKTGNWNAAAAALAADEPYYTDKGQVNYIHMLNAAAKYAGVTEVTDANLPDVIAALRQHAQDERQAAETPPL